MGSWSKTAKVLRFGSVALGVAAGGWYLQKDKSLAFNSWTTNTKPEFPWNHNWDHREPKSLVKPLLKANPTPEEENKYNEKLAEKRPKAVRHIILIRHGQYYLDGETDNERVLSDLGKKQALITGERLKSLKIPWDTLVFSTMKRAQETGYLIANHIDKVKIEDCSLIEEGAPVAPEPPVGHWRPEPSQFFQDGARIEAAFRKYFHRADCNQKADSYTMLVCHANVIRYFVCRALQFPSEAWLRLSLHHASITWISIQPSGRVILRLYGDCGHLPPDFVTTSNVTFAAAAASSKTQLKSKSAPF